MSDEIEKLDDVETTDETQTGTDQDKTEKVLKQSEVDQIIKNRLKREQDGLKKLQKDWESEKTSLNESIEKYEKVIGDLLADKKAKLTDTEKKLIEKLGIQDQIEFLLGTGDEEEKVEKPKIPITPKAKEKTNEKKKPYSEVHKF